jgi:hypothetical protein
LKLNRRDVGHHDLLSDVTQRLGEPARARADFQNSIVFAKIPGQVIQMHLEFDLLDGTGIPPFPLFFTVLIVKRLDPIGIVRRHSFPPAHPSLDKSKAGF